MVVVDIHVEVRNMVVVMVIKVVVGGMEMMVDMAAVVVGIVEVGVTSVEKMVISQGNVSKVVDMAAVVMGDMAARQWKRKWWE
ncbi:hypothetical protein H5410_001853 [Solanum commersonii]|uniref:Uncharacterized protein n=1 Tax=Solanum commersonii TaxID=4109 RepID=A0A9J6B091_SOLCO|nr:hypothetical protein H5410_001853 [Solanum commersonii]